MSDYEIHEAVEEAKTWRESFDALKYEMNVLHIDAASMPQLGQDLVVLEAKVNDAESKAEYTLKQLENVAKKRCFHTLLRHESKDFDTEVEDSIKSELNDESMEEKTKRKLEPEDFDLQ